jgi:hypothetical protein
MPKSVTFATMPSSSNDDHDVRGLHVAMHDVARVREGEPFGRLRDEVHGGRHVERLPAHELLELRAFDELHRHVREFVGAPHVVDRDDVRMVELADGLDLLREARLVERELLLREREADRLDRDDAVDDRVHRLVDDAHGALAEDAEHLVAADGLRMLVGHGQRLNSTSTSYRRLSAPGLNFHASSDVIAARLNTCGGSAERTAHRSRCPRR